MLHEPFRMTGRNSAVPLSLFGKRVAAAAEHLLWSIAWSKDEMVGILLSPLNPPFSPKTRIRKGVVIAEGDLADQIHPLPYLHAPQEP